MFETPEQEDWQENYDKGANSRCDGRRAMLLVQSQTFLVFATGTAMAQTSRTADNFKC